MLSELPEGLDCSPVSCKMKPIIKHWDWFACVRSVAHRSLTCISKRDWQGVVVLAQTGWQGQPELCLVSLLAPGTAEETWTLFTATKLRNLSWMPETALRGCYEYPSLCRTGISVQEGLEWSIYADLTAFHICWRVYVCTLSGQEKWFCRNLAVKMTGCSGLKTRMIQFSTHDKDL